MTRSIFAMSARITALSALAALGACATTAPPSPVSVTRFHDTSNLAQIGQGIVFVENAPGLEQQSLELAPYKSAIAAELAALGYREGPRSEADAIAQVSVETFEARAERGGRGPVSVGVGGGTGSYGSGVGLGVGINLGGGAKARVGREMSVVLKPVASDGRSTMNLWEGRALIEVTKDTPDDSAAVVAPLLAKALFRDFPGGNGDTTTVEIENLKVSE